MAGAPTIWVNGDMSEQIADFNGEYVLITTGDMKKILLGKTLEDAKKKLQEIGRHDIAAQLK
ncbi:hypothetical protein [Sporomusa acidovorans]|uniref:Uncharacterized protein n=1 Tax=Sporomusa acidovorans (strain ATCC 49682 / DSM 3132 / Mol) TaxID=1123286 RepID=A0ABZ3J8H0_SPOA4|nr:hypothetical protein [Sporomusa acidovorans]OZC16067.1 hypothetical protein SPACI_44340 [Sporomusa acidovorans DSM 3132]SDD87814.1 hypothetical protein SAMN04488499_100563 [Sporomusa acidovorans]